MSRPLASSLALVLHQNPDTPWEPDTSDTEKLIQHEAASAEDFRWPRNSASQSFTVHPDKHHQTPSSPTVLTSKAQRPRCPPIVANLLDFNELMIMWLMFILPRTPKHGTTGIIFDHQPSVEFRAVINAGLRTSASFNCGPATSPQNIPKHPKTTALQKSLRRR